jgi:anti-sigma factor RsiW
MNCQDAIDIMDDAIQRCLEPALRAGFEEHMDECPACGTYFEHLRLTRAALQLQRREGGTCPRREELIQAFKQEFDQEDD